VGKVKVVDTKPRLTDEAFTEELAEGDYFLLIRKKDYTKDNMHNAVIRFEKETGNFNIFVGSRFRGYSSKQELAIKKAKRVLAREFGEKYYA
jgi:hypothetical protein